MNVARIGAPISRQGFVRDDVRAHCRRSPTCDRSPKASRWQTLPSAISTPRRLSARPGQEGAPRHRRARANARAPARRSGLAAHRRRARRGGRSTSQRAVAERMGRGRRPGRVARERASGALQGALCGKARCCLRPHRTRNARLRERRLELRLDARRPAALDHLGSTLVVFDLRHRRHQGQGAHPKGRASDRNGEGIEPGLGAPQRARPPRRPRRNEPPAAGPSGHRRVERSCGDRRLGRRAPGIAADENALHARGHALLAVVPDRAWEGFVGRVG
jgi:hypothetical protein